LHNRKLYVTWNGTMFVDLVWPLNASSLLSASAELLVTRATSAVYATATWLAGWLDVTRRYCIKTAKPILRLFDLVVAPSF